jgi:energy-coupling factor transporter transmembrane protein EcfT
MGDAIAARGGGGQISAVPSRPKWRDAVALVIVAVVSAAAIAGELLLGATAV